MKAKAILRRLCSLPLRTILAFPQARRRVIFELRRSYFPELRFEVPLGQGLQLPFGFSEAGCSYEEAFPLDEYGPLLEQLPPIHRWLDLGSHAGCFSLRLLMEMKRRGIVGTGEALLVDGDPRSALAFREIVRVNPGLTGWRFLGGIIGEGEGSRGFAQDPFMASRVSREGSARVEVLPSARLEDCFPPPYDLIKADIEGAEAELIGHYADLLQKSRYFLLEQHDPPMGTWTRTRLISEVAALGFEKIAEAPTATKSPDAILLLFRRIHP